MQFAPYEPSFGGRLGEALGTGLSQGINQLSMNKLAEIQQKYQQAMTAQGLMGTGRYNEQQAQRLSMLPPELLKQELHPYARMGGIANLNPQDLEQGAMAIAEATGMPIEMAQHIMHQSPNVRAQLTKNYLENMPTSGFDMLKKGENPVSPPVVVNQPTPSGPAQQLSAPEIPPTTQVQPAQTYAQKVAETRTQKAQAKQEQEAAKLAATKQKTALAAKKEERQTQALEHKISKDDRAENRALNKEATEFSVPYQAAAEAARKRSATADELIAIAKTGKLRAGNWQSALKKFGLEDFFRNPETQTAGKLMSALALPGESGIEMKNVRLTNLIENLIMRSLPGLENTPEGIITISNVIKLLDKTAELSNDARADLLKESGGKVTYDLPDKIWQKIKPEVDIATQKIIDYATGLEADIDKHPLKYPNAYEEGTSFPDEHGVHILRKVNGKLEWGAA